MQGAISTDNSGGTGQVYFTAGTIAGGSRFVAYSNTATSGADRKKKKKKMRIFLLLLPLCLLIVAFAAPVKKGGGNSKMIAYMDSIAATPVDFSIMCSRVRANSAILKSDIISTQLKMQAGADRQPKPVRHNSVRLESPGSGVDTTKIEIKSVSN